MKTEALKQALDLLRLRRGVRRRPARRGKIARQGADFFFSRAVGHRWEPKTQRPELWNLYNTRINPAKPSESFRCPTGPRADVWSYIRLENIPIVPLYFAASRPVVKRFGQWIMVDDDRLPLEPGETPRERDGSVSHARAVIPLTAAIESSATTLDEIVAETLGATTSERQGRIIDHDGAGSMERKKQEGYF